MPNMSYCRFENTYNDMLDCLTALKEEGTDAIGSKREEHAAEDLMKVALRYVEVYKAAKERAAMAAMGLVIEEDE